MCLSQPSSLYQRCFLFPLLKGPGFPAVFLENFPIFEGFLRAKCFPTVKGRAQGRKKKRKKSKIPETNPYPGEEHLPPNIANMHKTCYVFFSMVCARLNFLFYFIFFFSPEVPERNPWNFFPRRSRRGTLETLLLVFFSSSSFVVRRVSMGILETDTWPEQDHKRESTLAQTFELLLWILLVYICLYNITLLLLVFLISWHPALVWVYGCWLSLAIFYSNIGMCRDCAS